MWVSTQWLAVLTFLWGFFFFFQMSCFFLENTNKREQILKKMLKKNNFLNFIMTNANINKLS